MQELFQQFQADQQSSQPFNLQHYQPLFVDVVQALTKRHQTITAAESLTAGLFQATLASVPGASQILAGGFVTYALEMKAQLLRISDNMLRQHGVVSSWTAEKMASQSATIIQSDWGVGLTGVAGPESLENQPAGTVWIGLQSPYKVSSTKFLFTGERPDIRQKSVVAAFIMVANSL